MRLFRNEHTCKIIMLALKFRTCRELNQAECQKYCFRPEKCSPYRGMTRGGAFIPNGGVLLVSLSFSRLGRFYFLRT